MTVAEAIEQIVAIRSYFNGKPGQYHEGVQYGLGLALGVLGNADDPTSSIRFGTAANLILQQAKENPGLATRN